MTPLVRNSALVSILCGVVLIIAFLAQAWFIVVAAMLVLCVVLSVYLGAHL